MPTLTRNGAFVEMSMPDMRVVFDTRYGGVPLQWYRTEGVNETLVSNSHAGAGASIAWNTGQDATQAGNNGLDYYPISRFDDPSSWPRSYYIRESLFDAGGCRYNISGFAPFFWTSLDAIDDTLPTDPRGASPWCTQYNNFLSLPPTFFTGFGNPLVFSPRGAATSGIIFPGNEIKNLNNPKEIWNRKLMRIGQGRFAHVCRISFKEAGPDAIAGILIRKTIPDKPGADINTAYAAPGCQLNFNKAGVCELVRIGYGPVWTFPGNLSALLNRPEGLQVELRTDNNDLNSFQIWLNGAYVVTATEPANGENFGYFATCSSGKIIFYDRAWFDVGSNFEVSYKGTTRNTLEITSRCSYMLPNPGRYRAHMPAVFLNPGLIPQQPASANPGSLRMWRTGGKTTLDWPGLDKAYPNQFGMYSGMVPSKDVRAVWLGSNDGQRGLFCKKVEVDNSGYVMQQADIVGFSPIPQAAESAPNTWPDLKTITEWSCRVREDIL